MAKFGNYDIKLEKADEKGMLDLKSIKQYFAKLSFIMDMAQVFFV